jgi:succinate dehydrogenase / fumarate reductase iron-sulfur subunit
VNLTLQVWRQQDGNGDKGRMVEYQARDISPDMSFLEMLDVVNEALTLKGDDPIAFDSDCREGICGMCGIVINGIPHGPDRGATACQLHMRWFNDGDTITVEPWRAKAFPVLKDLVVDRNAFDQIIQAGGFVSASTGAAPEANSTVVGKDVADTAMEAAACIGCGACVAVCPNASAMLFMSAKVMHLGVLPQGQPERYQRVSEMVETHDALGFGSCTNIGECSAVCPAEISLDTIAFLNRDLIASRAGKGMERS